MKDFGQLPSSICPTGHTIPLSVHPDPEVSDDEGCTIPRQSTAFPSSPLQCSSFLSNTTNEVNPIASLHISRKSRQPLSFSARTSYASEDLPLLSVLSPRLKELSSAQCFLVGYFFWTSDHSCCFPLPVLPWATYLFELKCSKLQTAPAKASLMLNTAEGFVHALHSIFHFIQSQYGILFCLTV